MAKKYSIPVIDFSEKSVEANTPFSWLSKCNQVREAFEEFGCFMAVYDDVSPEIKNQVLLSVKEIFDLPTETKMKNFNSEMPYFGYLRRWPNAQLIESMGIYNSTHPQAIQSFANLMWPYGNPHVCENFGLYAKKLSKLNDMVTKMLFESYGVEEYYDSHINSTAYVLRFNGYKPSDGIAKEDEKLVGAAAHTDVNFITILQQNDVKGLEVKSKDGTWIPLHFQPSSLVVFAAEAMLAWSNGRISPCIHRVMLDGGNEERHSIGMFSFHNGTIEIPEKLVDEMHPLKFKPFNHFDYLRFRLKQSTFSAHEDIIKMYCGI